MHVYGFKGDFDVFIGGELLTIFYDVTYSKVLELLIDFLCDDDDLEVRLRW